MTGRDVIVVGTGGMGSAAVGAGAGRAGRAHGGGAAGHALGRAGRLRRRAAQVLPGLTGPPVAATVCLYTTTPDSHFVIGPHPSFRNVVVACGFSGHGFKFVPVVGKILADLVLDGSTRHPIGLFDPLRFRSH